MRGLALSRKMADRGFAPFDFQYWRLLRRLCPGHLQNGHRRFYDRHTEISIVCHHECVQQYLVYLLHSFKHCRQAYSLPICSPSLE